MHRGRTYFCVAIIIGGLLVGCGERQRAYEEANEGKAIIGEVLYTEEQTKQMNVDDNLLCDEFQEMLRESIMKLKQFDKENENPYFYNREQITLQVHAEYHNGTEFVDEIADAEIYRVKTYEHGCVYRMIIYIDPFMSSWYFKSGEPLNIYFYVTADKIYRILPYAQPEPGGRSIDLYDDDNLLTETLDTDEKLQNNSIVVCQEEELQHEYSSITKDGNRITYYLSETKVNGEPGGEDLFVWEQGKGLVEFGTGFGLGPMDVHINSIDHVWHECNLPQEEWPDYDYFINAQQGHYNLTLENMAAFVVKDYALDSGMDKEEWELKRICYCEDAYQVYVESKTGNELYILLSEGQGIQPDYIIMADIRKGDGADISLYEGEYSYNSMLEWHSYMDWFDGKNTMEERPGLDVIGDLHDSVYGNGIFYAIYDYLDITNGDKKSHWEIDSNYMYIGRNGYIVCAYCSNGVEDVVVLVDVWNKSYAVLE